MTELQKTRLYDRHLQREARMMEFGGWLMPLDYGSIIEEHRHVRQRAGLFDVSHMGRLLFDGDEALEGLQRLLTIDLGKVAVGFAHYALLCNEQGGIVEDLILMRTGDRSWLLIVNAANKDKDVAWISRIAGGLVLGMEDKTDMGILALQGPDSLNILNTIADRDLTMLPKNGCAHAVIAGSELFLSRTGYTGEDGFELYPMGDHIVRIWDEILAMGIAPCGLGARDTLRIEAGLPLYGHELTDATNPYEAGLGWVIDLAKGVFVGREVLMEIKRLGPERKLVCLEIVGRNLARSGFLLLKDNSPAGHITSGTFSPTLSKSIAMGYVPANLAAIGTELEVGIRERLVPAIVTKKPFYRASSPRQ